MPFELPETASGADSRAPGRALLVQADLTAERSCPNLRAEEFGALARAAGIAACGVEHVRVRTPSSATLIGTGRLEQLTELVAQQQLPLAIFNNDLKPGQERNLERRLGCRVLDRTGLILDIFSRRAQSHAGRLQVELAQLQHLSARLQRGWSHLERQKGGIGLRGPGESQLETDRRLIGGRIKKLGNDLKKLRKQRLLSFKQRRRNSVPLVALVGYTNVGKSTIFNALTDAGVPADDRLFETLDTSMRRWHIGLETPVILADTVGFISDLPHRIIEAFHATLEGIVRADLLLIVEDSADPRKLIRRKEVQQVLRDIGADHLPAIRVLNKADIDPDRPGAVDRDLLTAGTSGLGVSALKNQGLDNLRGAVSVALEGAMQSRTLILTPGQGALRSSFYRRGIVLSEATAQNGDMELRLMLPDTEYIRLLQQGRAAARTGPQDSASALS